jgi:16S rRNA (guanine527-N7)-methyltransferase
VTEPDGGPVPATPRERAPLPTDVSSLPELGPGYASTLAAGLTSLGLTLTAAAAAAIDAQARLLLAWNQHINLTAIRTPDGVARLHVLDSLSAVRVLRERVVATPAIMDLGSGGGYPGLPLAVALPAARLTLVDSVAKKTRFLEVVAGAAQDALAGQGSSNGVVMEIIAARAEQLAADDHRESWDVVTARAVGTLAEVAELGLPLLRRGGLLVCWKREAASPDAEGIRAAGLDREIQDAGPLLTDLGADPPEVVPVEAAGLSGHRLVLVHKVRPTPRRFPRLPAERRRRLLR